MFLSNHSYTYIHSVLYNPTMFQGVTTYSKTAYNKCKWMKTWGRKMWKYCIYASNFIFLKKRFLVYKLFFEKKNWAILVGSLIFLRSWYLKYQQSTNSLLTLTQWASKITFFSFLDFNLLLVVTTRHSIVLILQTLKSDTFLF